MANLLRTLLRAKPKQPRPALAAGHLYPEHAASLQALVMDQLRQARALAVRAGLPAHPPRALVVPFGDLRVAGQVAAAAYGLLVEHGDAYERVALLAPAQRVPFAGVALGGFDAWSCPTGHLWVDADAQQRLLAMQAPGPVRLIHEALRAELPLELQLPYLRELQPRWSILPMLSGDGAGQLCQALLAQLADWPKTLIVVCTELSCELPPDQADALDAQTAQAIEALDPGPLSPAHATGRHALRALLALGRERAWTARVLERRLSAQLMQDPGQLVVGYAAAALWDPQAGA